VTQRLEYLASAALLFAAAFLSTWGL